MSESEIRKLLRRFKGVDTEAAFRQFYYLCYDRFFRIACYYAKDQDWSQEIVLDAFMKLWERRESLSAIDNIEDYCFILVKNTALNYLEKEGKHHLFSATDATETPEVCTGSPEDELITEELFAEYVKALDRLPERCREVFILVKEEKKSYAQVAEELQISVKTVDAQVQKAMKLLKEVVGRILEGE